MSDRTPSPRSPGSLSRRGVLSLAAATGAAVSLIHPDSARAAARPAVRSSFRTSLSVSPFTEAVLARTALTDGTRTARTPIEVQRLFAAHGAGEVFVRVATRRVATDNDAEHGLNRALQRAALARKLKLPLNPELGLWNVYGDISHQPEPDFAAYPTIRLPGPWTSLTIDQMARALSQYGTLVAAQILATGAQVNVWDIGNEVEFGLAGVGIRSLTTSTAYWTYSPPDAVDPAIGAMDFYTLVSMPDRIAWLQTHLWPHIGRMLAAVAQGIRRVDPRARFSTHTSTLSLLFPGMPEAFWRVMADAGFVADELGVSYYPTNQALPDPLGMFKASIAGLHTTFGKPVFVAETGCPSAIMPPPYEWNNPVPGYPQTVQGEYAFLRDL
jgi:hypothetical protein